MALFTQRLRIKSFVLLLLILLSILSACGSSSSGGGSGSKGTITVGGKQDIEAQLLSRMYVLLLQKAGYTINDKLALGDSPTVFQAIKSGAIDLYPEFTVTGLNVLGIPSSHNPVEDYSMVKTGFEKQFHITWLDPSPLNDTYALCTTKAEAQKLGITTISDLAPKVSQLTLATPSDGVFYVDDLKSTYGFTTKSFKSVQKVDYTIGFAAVKNNQAQVNICYTTDGSVPQQGFVFLTDTKNGFPAFNPAPIVRDSVLSQNPGIRDALNPLAPYLTTDVSISLRAQVAAKHASGMSVTQAVKQVATDFLKSKKLL